MIRHIFEEMIERAKTWFDQILDGLSGKLDNQDQDGEPQTTSRASSKTFCLFFSGNSGNSIVEFFSQKRKGKK